MAASSTSTTFREAASGMWRSEEMVKIDIVIQQEVVRDTVFHIGNTGMVQWLDTMERTQAFQRPYTPDIRRCEDLQRRLRFLHDQMVLSKIHVEPVCPEGLHPQPVLEDLNVIETGLEEAEREIRELNTALDSMVNEKNRCAEYFEVLRRNLTEVSGDDWGEGTASGYQGTSASPEGPRSHVIFGQSQGLMYIAGVIPDKSIAALERIIFRVTRGNSLFRVDSVDEVFVDAKGEETRKSVFVVYVSVERAVAKIRRLAESIGATTYQYTEDNQRTAAQMRTQLANFTSTTEQNQTRKSSVLFGLSKNFAKWVIAVEVEKNVLSAMNMLQYHGTVASGQCWISTQDLDLLQVALDEGSLRVGGETKPVVRPALNQSKPPTKFRTNKVTAVFQGIVDSYGVARYKEVNPAVFTTVSFPYLFGVMYGDIGHGMLITLVGAFLIFYETYYKGRKLNEIFAMIFGGRYLILAMGIMAVYMGTLYNDFFGVSLGLFTSGYTWPTLKGEDAPGNIVHPLVPSGVTTLKPTSTYEFGIDVSWTETENKLEFYNSVKMKCAVIIGITQMLAGIVLSLLNHIRARKWRYVLLNFIPEFVFLSCTFGYMALLIIGKWCTDWDGRTNDAPSLLETMTNFFLQPGTVTKPLLYKGQEGLQLFLLLVAFCMVPILLTGIPLLTHRERKERKQSHRPQGTTFLGDGATGNNRHHVEAAKFVEEGRHHDDLYGGDERPEPSAHGRRTASPLLSESSSAAAAGGVEEDEDEEPMSEIVIHYIIHTIEFVLGCVSNTASYLRLWALSLAHAQLSEVFLNFMLVSALDVDGGSGFIVFIGVAMWLAASIGVLVLMEGLSAFLHALRLHWVEFQNKFYKGDGYAFAPMDLMEISLVAYHTVRDD